MNIGIISQARTTSTRLPAKVLKKVCGITMLEHHINRLKQTGYSICIATTTNATDDVLAQAAADYSVLCYRGSEDNVLSRYYWAAKENGFDAVVRVTSDCPLLDPELIKAALLQYQNSFEPYLYLSNMVERSFARGFDFEVFSFQMLEETYNAATLQPDIEHVTYYMRQNRANKTIFQHVLNPMGNSSALRITLDTNDDLKLLTILMEQYSAHNMSYQQITQLLMSNSDLVKINAEVEQKKVSENDQNDLR
jgi:spore coat polysaccharide biosynthesis protein SpsF